jgi:hypothetical protein
MILMLTRCIFGMASLESFDDVVLPVRLRLRSLSSSVLEPVYSTGIFPIGYIPLPEGSY